MNILNEPLTGRIGPRWWPCCGVTTVAVISGQPFEEVLAHMRGAGQHNAAWRGRTRLGERIKALHHYGVTTGTIELYGPFSGNRSRMSFARWMRLCAKPGVTYAVDVTGHSLTYRDGFFVDQCNPEPCRVKDRPKLARKFMWTATEIMEG